MSKHSVSGVNELTNILGLNICVNQITLIVEVLESQEELLGDRTDKVHRYALLLVPLDKSKQVLA